MKQNLVLEKAETFAIRIVRLYNFLCSEKKEYVLSKQVVRSGTSVGANINESTCAISDKDFLSKLYIALKEAAETLYWLRLLHNTGYLDDKQFQSLYSDCEELKKLLQSITKTLKEKAEKQKIWIRKSEPETKNSKFQIPNSKFKKG